MALAAVSAAAASEEATIAIDAESKEDAVAATEACLVSMLDMINVRAYTWRSDALAALDFGLVRRDGDVTNAVSSTQCRHKQNGVTPKRQASTIMCVPTHLFSLVFLYLSLSLFRFHCLSVVSLPLSLSRSLSLSVGFSLSFSLSDMQVDLKEAMAQGASAMAGHVAAIFAALEACIEKVRLKHTAVNSFVSWKCLRFCDLATF